MIQKIENLIQQVNAFSATSAAEIEEFRIRILGKKGHLSNESSAQAAVRLLESGTKHLLLGHLSNENNDPHLAYRTVHAALLNAGAEVGRDVTLNVAGRYQVSHLYTMK